MAKFVFSAFADEAGSTLEEQISTLKDNGIGYIEPRKIDGKGILELSREELLSIKKALDENGIKVNALGSPIGKYPIKDDFETHLLDFEKALTACEVLETENIRMFSFFTTPEERKTRREEILRRLTYMVNLAEKRGIRLCHENESLIYGEQPDEVRDLLRSIPGLYGIFDPANYRMNDADVMDGIDATLINFGYMHIKDAIFETQTIVPAGEGEGKIGEIIDVINENVDDTVYLTLEPHLHVFDAYKDIDEHELRGKYSFDTGREAFDFAVVALEKLLTDRGYRKDGQNQWIKQ